MAREISPWIRRPPEVANLLNPAFIALLLWSATRGYSKEDSKGIPLNLAYLVVPIVLHRDTREALPASTKSRMHSWLQAHPAVTIGFPERARAMVPYTREGLLFGVQYGTLRLNSEARVETPVAKLKPNPFPESSEPSDCMRKAELVGRLFVRVGDPVTVLAMWGVRP